MNKILYMDYYLLHEIIIHHAKAGSQLENQNVYFEKLLQSYIEAEKPDGVDPATISRITRGIWPVMQKIKNYYDTEDGLEKLAHDIDRQIFPEMRAYKKLVEEIWYQVYFDTEMKWYLSRELPLSFPFQSRWEEALFVARVVQYSLCRQFYQRNPDTGDIALPQWYYPKLTNYILGSTVPQPCRYFLGRESEVGELHKRFAQERVVFLYGLPGIGKSQLSYYYCKQYKNYYSNILYIDYSGDLYKDICKLKVTGVIMLPQEEYDRNLQFLQYLREDTLLVLDNVNATFEQEECLAEVLDCGCRVLVTTRCVYDQDVGMCLEEIQNMDELVDLVKKVSRLNDLDCSTIQKLIEALDRHTMAVVLMASLLRRKRYDPKDILHRLMIKKFFATIEEKIPFKKGERRAKISYYDHLRTLFGLHHYAGDEEYAIQNMILMPKSGIKIRLFEAWIGLHNFDVVNELIEAGVLDESEHGIVKMKPIIREVAREELKPSIVNCGTMIRNVTSEMDLLRDGSRNKYLLELPTELIEWAEKDDMDLYIRFLHAAFVLSEKYDHEDVMRLVTNTLTAILKDGTYGSDLDRALTLDYQATLERDPEQSIILEKKALELLSKDSFQEKQTVAEIMSRLAGKYCDIGQWKLAEEYSDKSWIMLQGMGLTDAEEAFPFVCTRGIILCTVGRSTEGLALMQKMKCFIEVREQQETMNYAILLAAMSEAYQIIGDMKESSRYAIEADRISKKIMRQMK